MKSEDCASTGVLEVLTFYREIQDTHLSSKEAHSAWSTITKTEARFKITFMQKCSARYCKKNMFQLFSTGGKNLLHVPNNRQIDSSVYSRQKLLDPRYNSEIKTNGTSDVSFLAVYPRRIVFERRSFDKVIFRPHKDWNQNL